MKRRKFIKYFSTAAGSILIPGLFFRDSEIIAGGKTEFTPHKPNPADWKSSDVNIAWIGHSTVLINLFGTIILTDPVLFQRVGLYAFGITIGPSRYSNPALSADEIPRPDIILLSHAHMDHMDYESLLFLSKKFPGEIECITAYNTADVIQELDWKSLQEVDWTQEILLQNIRFKAIEVNHFGWRYPWERDRSKGYFENGRSYNAYIIEKNGKKILFGGDTAYSDKFIKSFEEGIEIAIMPIGAYQPWKRNHCNPEEALIMASQHLKAKYFVPIHCNTFKQGSEPIEEPINWMITAAEKFDIKIGIKEIGQTFTAAV
jgi:L-ascorbate metabolism protein UlaG (beta-lactamase superfamily)